MKKQLLTLATVLFAAGALFTSCANDPEEVPVQPDVPTYQPTFTGN